MRALARVTVLSLSGLSVTGMGTALWAQQLQPDAQQTVREAVAAEMNACVTDDSHWRYRDDQRELGLVSFVVETTQGAIKQTVMKDGHPLTGDERAQAEAEMERFVHSPDAQRKQRRDAENDDKQSQIFLQMLPAAFVWRVEQVSGGEIRLSYRPNPEFHPPSMEARVMGAMSGEMVVDQAQHRIRTMKGRLLQDVTFGWGILGRLKAGGTFDVERRQVGPGIWEITSTSVNIVGHALFFKNISEQQDEVKTDFVEVPNGTTLQQAADMVHTMVDNAQTPSASSTRAER